jgi:hypothetical protein
MLINKTFLFISCILFCAIGAFSQSISEKTIGTTVNEGFYTFYWDDDDGKIWLEIREDQLEKEFLYVHSLATGVGSNDIGLDRGQLGGERIVKFSRMSNKIMLVQPNYTYRALSDNLDEQLSVKEAFAESILYGFLIEAKENGKYLVDATSFLMQDAHGVSSTLRQSKQGNYSIDGSRSAMYLPRTKSFPKNTEFEVTLTFTGSPNDYEIQSVVPTASAVTVRQHHSFVELPDNNYTPREFDPRSGFFNTSFYDYASAIGTPMEKRYIARHRLEKKDPKAAISEAVEPIIYYLDRGTPEPVRSALLDGARWWNQAFEAAGYKDAFQVEILPEGADMMDVRYNVIQWVHRSTRGWSYGASVTDPRTGEIIKGHVSLGSLRVRQDYLIAQGLLSPFENGDEPDPRLLEMSLARLRQLSAHEVGHTIGLAHNFAASTNNRASVMDYPHPYITIGEDGKLDFSDAYDTKIGDWDKRTVLYGYQDFPDGTNEAQALAQILKENNEQGFRYLTDRDARPEGSPHPQAHLWDNGSNAVKELDRILTVRAKALENFGINSIPTGEPLATLENVFVPLYLSHRYQVEATAKVIGGVSYKYAMRGEKEVDVKFISKDDQLKALEALLKTLEPQVLAISDRILKLIPPMPQGYSRGREHFPSKTGLTFDYLSAAESAAHHTISLILHPERVNRLVANYAIQQQQPTLDELLQIIIDKTFLSEVPKTVQEQEIRRVVQHVLLDELMRVAINKATNKQGQAVVLSKIGSITNQLKQLMNSKKLNSMDLAFYNLMVWEIERFQDDPSEIEIPSSPKMPDGAPIGCDH